MPDWQCWCDQDWYASVLADCRMASSDLETPFRCPTDVFFHSGKLDEALVHFRMASFLSNPRVRGRNGPHARPPARNPFAWSRTSHMHDGLPPDPSPLDELQRPSSSVPDLIAQCSITCMSGSDS